MNRMNRGLSVHNNKDTGVNHRDWFESFYK